MASNTHSGYCAVIGLEVHAQLALKRKVFSPEGVEYGALPNTKVSLITLAHPGTLPRVNPLAIAYTIKMGLACKSTIAHEVIFERKNYFYPDLPKGYQITQGAVPLCRGGAITIDTPDIGEKAIALARIHLEEDTGKSLHGLTPGKSLLDFNRAGVALIEIVTQPVLTTSQEAYHFLSELRKLVRYLDICDGNMEEGSLRCDANISVMPRGATTLGQRVEVKNMNSMRNVQLAIDYEIQRQITRLVQGETIIAETRTYTSDTWQIYPMRAKEEAKDYRYFPDPDFPVMRLPTAWVEQLQHDLPLLPRTYYKKLREVYKLPTYDALVLTEDRATAMYFEALCQLTTHYKAASNWLMGPVKSYLNAHTLSIDEFPLAAATLAALIALVVEGKLSFSVAVQRLYPALLNQPHSSPLTLAKELDLLQEDDVTKIQTLIDEVINMYPSQVTAYCSGKKGIIGMLMGEIMKKSHGKVSPQKAKVLLHQCLDALANDGT